MDWNLIMTYSPHTRVCTAWGIMFPLEPSIALSHATRYEFSTTHYTASKAKNQVQYTHIHTIPDLLMNSHPGIHLQRNREKSNATQKQWEKFRLFYSHFWQTNSWLVQRNCMCANDKQHTVFCFTTIHKTNFVYSVKYVKHDECDTDE